MALQVGELYATLKIDDRGADQQINGLGVQFSKFGAVATGAMAAVGSAITVAIGAGVAAMSQAVTTGVQYNAMLEQSAIAWETLTKSQEIAAQTMKDLQQLAAKTPFEFEGLDKAAKLLHMAGFQGKELTKTLTIVGDAVSAVGGQEELQGAQWPCSKSGPRGKFLLRK
ncbi:hypothetical protein SAMN06265361_10514 [Laceyella tengchongensis]|uniref:Phage tail tape measure protein n=1 Tax=Laceyella tengchongensis TaxID=574699 RepID=A0AA45WQF0_9BACL|nr:hypothetical protein [Laceyella tengchongensis]SMP25082.1 hypothetical protein SAMN06265361_10514 [Laceyella tengchongensis]